MLDLGPQYPATGYAPMDDDHAALSDDLGRFVDLVNTKRHGEALAVLQALVEQFGEHFAREEQLMAEAGYPQAARHADAHVNFLKDAAKFVHELAHKGITEGVRRWATGRVQELFRFHIVANDVGLGRFLLSRERVRPGAAPVA